MSNIVDYRPLAPHQPRSPSPQSTSLTSRRDRIVTTERQRAARACDSCRRAKEKCIGVPCRRCVRLERQCEFKNVGVTRRTIPKKRNSSRSVDDGVAREFHERITYLERIIKHYAPGLDLRTENLRQKARDLAPEDFDPAEDVSGSPSIDSNADVTIQDESCTINAVNDIIAHYSGEFSYWNFSMRLNKEVKDLIGSEDQQDIPHYWRVGQLHSSSTAVSEALSNLPPLPIANFLVHVFLKHAASNYFYFDSHWLLEKLNIMYGKPPELTSKDAGIVAIILGVLAIGTQYAHLESPRNVRTRNGPQSHREDELGDVFYQQAVRLLPEVIHLGSLESVQGCLLFGLYALPIDASGLGYIYLNLAMKLAMQNGMHRRTPDHVFAPEMTERRNKIWWTVYCLEKKISIYHGRPISIRPSDIDAELPREEPELQVAEPSSNISSLLTLVKLMDYLGKFADDILMLRTGPRSQAPDLFTRLKSRRDELKRWWDASSLKSQRLSRSHVHLQLEYCLLRMFLGRPFLVGRDVPGLSPGVASEDPMIRESTLPEGERDWTQHPQRKSRASAFVDDCVVAATEAIDLCQSLLDEGAGLASVSYIEYSSCRASLLVLIAFCIRTQTLQYYDHQQKGLQMIRDMATTGESARHEVLLIEALDRALKRLHLLDLRNQSNKSSETQRNINYDDFKQWETAWKAGSATAELGPSQGQLASMTTQQRYSHGMDRQVHEAKQVTGDTANFANKMRYGQADLASNEPYIVSQDRPPVAQENTYVDWNSMQAGPNVFYDHIEEQLLENFLAIPEDEFSFSTGLDTRQQTDAFGTMNWGEN